LSHWREEGLRAGTVIWAAGVAASPAAAWLGVEADRAGRVKVGARLTPPGSDDVFVIGDTALALDANGVPLPGLAPVAKQQGVYVTEVIKARLAGKTDVPPIARKTTVPSRFPAKSNILQTHRKRSSAANFKILHGRPVRFPHFAIPVPSHDRIAHQSGAARVTAWRSRPAPCCAR
jgi:NADH dehydrogenase FAD-containing subunit